MKKKFSHKFIAVQTQVFDWERSLIVAIGTKFTNEVGRTGAGIEKIRAGLSDVSESIARHYLTQLCKFLDDTLENRSVKLRYKILETFTTNVLAVLQDAELPDSIKLLAVEEMPRMGIILEKMFSRAPNTLLTDGNGISHFQKYQDVCTKLKKDLIKERDAAGITFSGRNLKLFAWCRQELDETASPLIKLLLDSPNVIHSKTVIKESFDKLSDALNLLIFHISTADDVADNIQDGKLTSLFAQIPFNDCNTLRGQVEEHRDSFLAYFDIAVETWKQAVNYLIEIFGEDYFGTTVQGRFLNIMSTVSRSLTYSQNMNENPHHPEITKEGIYETLAPNIMVYCFGYLQNALVEKFAGEYGVTLPSAADLKILDAIMHKAEKNATMSNAAATAPRERQERDLSSPLPFEVNEKAMQTLKTHGKQFHEDFEEFLRNQGYSNHFFATYLNTDTPDGSFDFLSLIKLGREAMTQLIGHLLEIKRLGHKVPDTDFSFGTLASSTIQMAQSASETLRIKGAILAKLKWHIELIDKFSAKLMEETGVQNEFFVRWQKEVETMCQDAETMDSQPLRHETLRYVQSWKDFLCMYLLFKRSLDGTI